MKQIVAEKLAQIDELFPPERVEASKKRIRDIWNGKKPEGRYPYVYYPISFNYYDDAHPAEERLLATLDELILRGQFEDDFIPAVFPGCKQSTIPSMFGAKELICGEDYCSEKIVFEPQDVYKLGEPRIEPGSVAAYWIDMQKYLYEETEGRLGIHITDMQGPADVCGQLWGYDNLFVSAYTDPKEYDEIMSKATGAFLMLWERQKEVLQESFIGTHLFGWSWAPEGNGATVSADSIVMVSPDFFDEFYAPYLDRISDATGGLILHSCGDFSHLMPNLYRLNNIRGINAGQMTVEELLNAGLDDRLVAIAQSKVEDAEYMFRLVRDNGLRMDLTIVGAWPGDPYNPNKPEEWTDADWNRAKHINETLQKISEV